MSYKFGRMKDFFWGAFLPHLCGSEEFCHAPYKLTSLHGWNSPCAASDRAPAAL